MALFDLILLTICCIVVGVSTRAYHHGKLTKSTAIALNSGLISNRQADNVFTPKENYTDGIYGKSSIMVFKALYKTLKYSD
jgi:hypothetical protein